MLRRIAASLAMALGLAVLAPATAHAQPAADQYMSDLRAGGFTPKDRNTALLVGMAVCVDLFNGATLDNELDFLMQIGATKDDAMVVVRAAQNNFCPKTLTSTHRSVA